VRVFSLSIGDNIDSADTWNRIGNDIFGDLDGDLFGCSISFSDDGRTLAVGACRHAGNHQEDCVKIYRMDDTKTSWIQIGDVIYLGYVVSLSADGSKVAIGSPYASWFEPASTGCAALFFGIGGGVYSVETDETKQCP
jgi:hypothetical protein